MNTNLRRRKTKGKILRDKGENKIILISPFVPHKNLY